MAQPPKLTEEEAKAAGLGSLLAEQEAAQAAAQAQAGETPLPGPQTQPQAQPQPQPQDKPEEAPDKQAAGLLSGAGGVVAVAAGGYMAARELGDAVGGPKGGIHEYLTGSGGSGQSDNSYGQAILSAMNRIAALKTRM